MSAVMDSMPFVYKRAGELENRLDIKSLVQGLIVAIGTGILVMYGTQQTLKVQLETMSADISEIKQNQKNFRNDFYGPRDFYK